MNARDSSIAKGELVADAPDTVVSSHFYALDSDTQSAILDRAAAARPLTDSYAIDHTWFSFPVGRALESAHDATLQRGWAHYEPLPTENALGLARAAQALRPQGLKESIYTRLIAGAGVADLPVNPDAPGTGGGAWLSFARVLGADEVFASEFDAIASVARDLLGLPPGARRERSLLANVYWANRITTERS
jgi:hypothetical protein